MDVKHSVAGGFNCFIDESNVNQVGHRSSSADSECVTPGSQQVEELVEIEESVCEKRVSDDWGTATDDDLVLAYNDALAIDVEPEDETIAGLVRKYSRPVEDLNESDDDGMPSQGHLA